MTASIGAFTAEPARSARNSAVQWTTRTPARRAAVASRAAFVMTLWDATSAARSGTAARSPMTPRCISIVSIAVWPGASSSTRSIGMWGG